MRTLIIIPVLLFLLLLGAPSYSADFDKGLTAAQNGDFATALKEWKPLAEQGLAEAQYNLGLMYHNGDGVPQDYKEAAAIRLKDDDLYLRFRMNLGNRIQYQTRKVYSYLSFGADVGGLWGCIQPVFSLIVAIFSGAYFNADIIQ